MDLQRVEKKLREARFFLNAMITHESGAFGDREPFDFYLSAFLSAARTVDYRLIHEQRATYRPWRKKWETTLSVQEAILIKSMTDDRNLEVHETGSSRDMKDEKTKIAGTYTDRSGTVTVSGPPETLGFGPQGAYVVKPTYYFTIDGVERRVTEACGEHLRLLERMLAEFKSDHS